MLDFVQLSQHYLGPVRPAFSEDGQSILYDQGGSNGSWIGPGVTDSAGTWQPASQAPQAAWQFGSATRSDGFKLALQPDGSPAFFAQPLFDQAGRMVWDGGRMVWDGGRMVWDGGRMVWDGGYLAFAADLAWTQPARFLNARLAATQWVDWP